MQAAVKYGHLDVVKFLFEECKVSLVDEKSKKNENLVHIAARYGRYEVLKYVTEKGCSVLEKSSDNVSSLVQAVINGHLQCADYLIEKGAVKDFNLDSTNDCLIRAFTKQ